MKKIAGIVAVVVLIVIAGLIFKKNMNPPVQSVQSSVFVDTRANKIFYLAIPLGTEMRYPLQSPLSGGDAYPAYKCTKDGTVFAVKNTGVSPKCPVCGSTEAVAPEIPAGQTEMDIQGPVTITE